MEKVKKEEKVSMSFRKGNERLTVIMTESERDKINKFVEVSTFKNNSEFLRTIYHLSKIRYGRERKDGNFSRTMREYLFKHIELMEKYEKGK